MTRKVTAINEGTVAGVALTYRKLKGNPPSYRFIFDGVEIGSISLRTNHITNNEYWHWRIDLMRAEQARAAAFLKALGANI